MCLIALRWTRLRPCCHVVYCEACAQAACRDRLECLLCRGRVERFEVGEFRATFVPK